MVNSIITAEGPTLAGNETVLNFSADCHRNTLSVVAMIAPSPDWLVFISNMDLYSMDNGAYVAYKSGMLYAWDAGTDMGRLFTAPSDLSLDEPQEPVWNIAPLEGDDTDAFFGNPVGSYVLQRTA